MNNFRRNLAAAPLRSWKRGRKISESRAAGTACSAICRSPPNRKRAQNNRSPVQQLHMPSRICRSWKKIFWNADAFSTPLPYVQFIRFYFIIVRRRMQ